MNLITKIISNQILEQAFAWVCKSRINSGDNNSVWILRRDWEKVKEKIRQGLLTDTYHLSPLRRFETENGDLIDAWEAEDAVVLKAIALVLSKVLKIPKKSTSAKGNGGFKYAIKEVKTHLNEYEFVFKSDVKSYYQSIDHELLLNQLKEEISDKRVLRIIQEYCERLVWIDGEYELIKQGIPLGCPLSPLIGAWYLKDLDNAMMKLKNVFYIRFADDWLVLTKTHSQLRKAIRIMEKILASLKMLKHPDKTFIGKISKGFDFLGYRLSPTSLGLSDISIERRTAKLVRLYEQGAPKERIVQYWRKWKLAYQLKFDIEYKGKVVEAVFNACGQSYKLIMLGRPQHQTTLS